MRSPILLTLLILVFLSPSAEVLGGSDEAPADSRAEGAQWLAFGATFVPPLVGIAVAADDRGGSGQTAIFTLLFWGGLVAGPAAGYAHGGAGDSALTGLAVRTTAFALAAITDSTSDFDDGMYPNPEIDEMRLWPLATLVIGISAVIDIARIDDAVRRAEESRFGVRPVINGDRVGLVAVATW